MSGRLVDIAGHLFGTPQDKDGVVHENTRDLVKAEPPKQGFRVQGNHIIVGEGTKIVDRRPRALELMDGQPLETTVFQPKHILPRNRNRYNHRELERERVRASLAKEKP